MRSCVCAVMWLFLLFLFPIQSGAGNNIGLSIGIGKLGSDGYNHPYLLGFNSEHKITTLKNIDLFALVDIEGGTASNKHKDEPPSDVIWGPDYIYRINQNYSLSFEVAREWKGFIPAIDFGLSLLNYKYSSGTKSHAFEYGIVLNPHFKTMLRQFYCEPQFRYQILFGVNTLISQYWDYGASVGYAMTKMKYKIEIRRETNRYKTKSGQWHSSDLEPIWVVVIGAIREF